MNYFADIHNFNHLFNEYYERFIHFAMGYVKEKETVEDYVSEALITLQACDPEYLFSKEIRQIIDETLHSLPQKTRGIFILNRFDGLSYKEIAKSMNLNAKSIEFHISKTLTHGRSSLV